MISRSFVEVLGVAKAYGSNRVLKSIDFSAMSHEVVCIIGASGCGKSTLLRCIAALEPVDGGEIRVGDTIVSHPAVDADFLRRSVGIVFQSYNLFPHLSVMQNLCLGPLKVLKQPKSEAVEKATRLLKVVGLADKTNAYPDALSGGQQQRVAIARALAMDPELLLLDEVTAALDPGLVGEVLAILKSLAGSGMTMLVATHEMQFARDVADRVVFMADGYVHEEGPAKAFFEHPQKPLTQAFLQRLTDQSTRPAGLPDP